MNNKKLAQHLEENKARQERWKHLTEGIKNDYERIVLENLLENTKAWIAEASTSQNVDAFTTFAFPLIRRIFPNLIANQLVSVQPMSMPTGLIFYLDYKYSTGLAPTVAGDRMDYQAGKFNPYYGSGARGEVPTGTVNGTNAVFTAKFYPVVASSVVAYVNSSSVTISSVNPATGAITLATPPANGSTVTIDYNIDLEGNDNYGEIEFDMSSDTITAEQKRLKAKWTLEAQQDLYAYHGVDAENELVAMLGDEVKREIDRMIVSDLYKGVGFNVNWTKAYPGTASGYSKKEYDSTLLEAMVDAENAIYKKRLVKANWVVASPDVCARLEKVNGFRFAGDNTGGDVQKGINLFGAVQNRWTIYSDPLAPADKILMGYKGTNFFETGYVYAPYVPLYTTPTIMLEDFKPRRAVMSRFARKQVTTDFYAQVTLV